MWSALFLTLPTQPNAVRLRVWRALKSLGCGSLRDGVYVLPHAQCALFDAVVAEVREHGGQASVFDLSARGQVQQAEILALFDRAEAYGQWRSEARTLIAVIPGLEETEARRRWRGIAEALQTLRRIDYYPGAAAEQAQAELDTLRQALDARFSRGEPVAQAPHGIPRLDPRKFQGKRWATRARFTHVGSRVSVEVLAASFGLDADLRLQRIARAVHFLDVGGIPVPEAAGLEAVLSGLREVHADDDDLNLAAAAVFDALYAAPGAPT